MCGIAGRVNFTSQPVEVDQIKKMTDCIAYRGPDDEGQVVNSNVGLGSRRLAVIDLSPAGHQPMSYLDKYWIAFNGEIYNFEQERKKLEAKGYKFKSHSDTEVILALYDLYGQNCLTHLRGMFSFAIHDKVKNVLFCARDRVGKKPFKYFHNSQTFIFASELKAILTQTDVPRVPDKLAIHHYLTLQYVPAPLTGFEGIKKLPAGHMLTLDLKSNTIKTESYWRLDYSRKLDLSEDEWHRRVMEKLDESVRLRMISDVPIGAFLSGGIDSSAIVALMSRHSSSPVKTFSIGFEEEKFSELKYARMVADKFKTDHTEFIVKPNALELLPLLAYHYEEPYADSSALPTYLVSKLTREHVTVALNGDGGDENFAGYSRYSIQKFALLYDHFLWLHKITGLPLATLGARLFDTTFFERAKRFAETLAQPYGYRYVNYIRYFSNEAKDDLYTNSFKEAVASHDSYQIIAEKFLEAKTPDKLDQTLYADFSSYLPEDLLVKVDIATSAVGLEGRSPFLDHEMLELTAKIPFELKLRGRDQKKYILKKALRGIIPNEVMDRPKMGFGVPIEDWFRGGLNAYTRRELLSDRSIGRGLFRRESIEKIINAHQTTKVNYANQIWALLTLEEWFRAYFD